MSMLFEKLPYKEQLEYYITHFAGYEDTRNDGTAASLEYLMRVWGNAKGKYLYQLLGNEFTIKREFEYDTPEDDLFKSMRSFVYGHPFIRNYERFVKTYLAEVYEFNADRDYRKYWDDPDSLKVIDDFNGMEVSSLFDNLVSITSLVRSYYDHNNFKVYLKDGKTIPVNHGAKPMRILRKIVEAFGIEGFEEFCIGVSQILNKKKLKGTACLSIHPLNYITMSDNANGWESCMKWMDGAGCYRLGTVEMMNSDCVVVAYIESKDHLYFGPHQWNSKKWRNLFIVDERFISSVKAYPFQSDELDEYFLEWLRELAQKNLGWTYNEKIFSAYPDSHVFDVKINEDHNVEFEMITCFMYNDFGNGNKPHLLIADQKIGDYIDFCYSGDAECMFCGQTFRPDNEGYIHGGDDASTDMVHEMCDVICIECTTLHYCDHCGCAICRDEECYEVDGTYLCEECYEDTDLVVVDSFTGERHYRENCEELVVFREKINDTDVINLDIYNLYNVTRGYGVPVYSIDQVNDYLENPVRYYHIKTQDGHTKAIPYCVFDDINDSSVRWDLHFSAAQNLETIYGDMIS